MCPSPVAAPAAAAQSTPWVMQMLNPVLSAAHMRPSPAAAAAAVQNAPWVMEMLKLALRPGLPEGQELPELLFFDELEQLNNTQWVGFERVLHIRDRSGLGWSGRRLGRRERVQ